MLPDHHLITVYEAANDTRREVYVGTTNLLIDQLIRAFHSFLPRVARHWKKEDRILFRCVEYSIPVSEARKFIDGYAKSDALKGWKVLRDEPAARPSGAGHLS